MTLKSTISLIILWSVSSIWTNVDAQSDGVILDQYLWLSTLIDSIEQDSDLCTTCTSPPEIRSYIAPRGALLFRLHYDCASLAGFSRFYEEDGTVLGICKVGNNNEECDIGLTTTYTFGRNITTVWSCDIGYNCQDVSRFDLFTPFETAIKGDPCDDEVRIIHTSVPFDEYHWTFPDGTSSIEPAPTVLQSGSYDLIVTREDGCKDTVSTMVDLNEEVLLSIDGERVICNGPIELSLPGFVRYEWSTGDTTETIEVDQEMTVTVLAYNALGCIQETTIQVEDQRDVTIDIIHNYTDIYDGQQVEFTLAVDNITAGEISEISWSVNGAPSTFDGQNISFIITGETHLRAHLMTKGGCIFSDDILLEALAVNRDFYLPTVFNPNSDNGNDRFYAQGLAGTIEFKNMTVYDRWGMPVYENEHPQLNDYDAAWDGTRDNSPLPMGNYVYTVEIMYANGESEHRSGVVLLVH